MGNPSPAASKLKKDSPTSSKVGPHRRTSSVASSCVSLESGDQDVQSPARINGLGKSPAASVNSPRTPAGEKSVSPAMKKRRSSIGGSDDLARGLDFGTSSPPVEEKKHPFLTRGGGHKKVVSPASVTAQTNSPGKKITITTTPPGKEKVVAGRATAASVLFPRKLSDGREAKKDISSPRRPGLASEGSSINESLNEGTGSVAEQVTPKKSSPRASLDGKIISAKSSPRPNMKAKSDIASIKGRTNSNGESAGNDSPLETETKADKPFSPGKPLEGKSETKADKSFSPGKSLEGKAETKADKSFSPGKSLDGKIRKSSPLPSLKSKPATTSPKSQKLAKRRQDTPSPPQTGRARTRIDVKAARYEELSRPELESVTLLVSSEKENGVEAKSEDVVEMETEEDGSTLLPSLMVDGNVGDEDMSSLDQAGGEPDFDHETELPSTSWLSEDLPCMFSSLSHLPEPDGSSSSPLGDPPEVLDDQPFLMEADDLQGFSDESFLGKPNDANAAEMSKRPVVTVGDKLVAADKYSVEVCKDMDKSELNSESNSFNLVEDSVDKFETELRAHGDEHESQQTLGVPAVVEEDVVPLSVSQSLLTHDKGETMSNKFTTHPEDISSSIESPDTERVAHEASLQSIQITENMPTEERNLLLSSGEGRSEPISSQIVAEPTEITEVVPGSFKADEEICHVDSSYCAEERKAPDAIFVLQEEERGPAADEDEISATHSSLDVVASSDDESSEEFLGGACSAQVNLKQSFDDAAEPAAWDTLPRGDTCEIVSQDEEILPEVAKLTELEFGEESQDGEECGAFTLSHLDKDMMIFDFEEYWTHNVGDESSQSDAGQNDAEDLQPNSKREAQILNPVKEEADICLPQIELPVSSLPVEESIDFEPPGQSSPQLDSAGWPRPNFTASVRASDNCQMDTESANQEEFDEVFHLLEGSDKLSTTTDVLFDNLSSPSKPTAVPEELDQEPLHPILSQSLDENIAGESDFSLHSTSTFETEHSNGVNIEQVGQNLQTLNVPEDKDVERVSEHQSFSVNTFALQDLSVVHLSSNTKSLECPVDQEDLGTLPMASNGLLGADIQHLDGNDASDEIVDSEELGFSPISIEGASQKSSFETPALSDAYMAVQSDHEALDLGPKTQEVCAITVQTVETNDNLDGAKTDDVRELSSDEYPLEIDYSQYSSDRDFTSPISEIAAGTEVSHEEISSKLLMVEGDENVAISGQSGASAGVAAKGVDPLESHALAISLPPVSGISEEEQTEAKFLASLDSKEESVIHTEDSITDHELHINLGQEEPQGLSDRLERVEITKGYSGYPVGGDFMPVSNEPKGIFQDMSSESREDKNQVPEHDDFQMPSGAVLPVEERPKSQDDGRITTPALQTNLESHADVNMSEVDQQPLVPLISTPLPETLHDRLPADDETLDYVPKTAAANKSLSMGVQDESSDTCSPVFDQEDDKFDFKSEVKSTASLDQVDVGANTVIAATGATIKFDNYTDKTSSAEILRKDEAIYSPAAAPGELSQNEVGEFNKLGSECTSDEERRGIVDFGEQSRAEQGWEEPLPAADLSASKLSTENVKRELLSKESMVTNPASSVEAADERRDTTEDVEIDMDEPEETSCTILTPASKPNEMLEYHDQESHLLFGTSIPAGDQVSSTQAALETQKVLVASADATFDGDMSEVALDDHAIKNAEIVPGYAEHFSSKEMPWELLVASNQDNPNAAILDVGEMKEEESDLTQKTDKEGEKLNGVLEPNSLLKGEDTVVDSPKKSFILSTAKNMDADEREENSTFPWKANEERGSLNGSLKEEAVLEVEKTVVYSPKNSFVVAPGQADTPDANDHSNVSWTAGKEEESLEGNLEEESLLADEDSVVYGPKVPVGSSPQNNPNKTNLSSSGIHNPSTTSWKEADSEDSFNENPLEENPLLEDEDMVGDSPEKSFCEEHSNSSGTAGKEKSLNGNLERDSVFDDEEQVVYSPKSQFNVGPDITISDVNDIQHHSNVSWTPDEDGESLNGSLKDQSLLEDDDTVVYRPTVEESTPEVVEKVDSHIEFNKVPDHDTTNASILVVDDVEDQQIQRVKMEDEETVAHRPTLEESKPEVVEKVVNGLMELNNAPDHDTTDTTILIVDDVEEQQTRRAIMMEDEDTVVHRPSLEGSTPEVVEKVVDSHLELNSVSDHDTTNAATLIVDDAEEQRTRRVDEDTVVLKSTVKEFTPEVGNSHIELNDVPDRGTTNAAILIDDDVEEQQTTQRVKMEDEATVLHRPTVEESTPEVVEKVVSHMELNSVPDHDTTNAAILIVDDVEEQQTRRVKTVDDDKVVQRPIVEESTPDVVVDSHMELNSVPDHDTTSAAILIVDDMEEHQTRRDDKEGESSKESVLEVEETVDSTTESVVPDLVNTNSKIVELPKHSASEIDNNRGTLNQRLEEKSTSEVEETAVERSKESLVSDDNNATAEILDAENLDKHPKWKTDEEGKSLNGTLQQESIVEAQNTVVDSSSDNVKKESVCLSEENGAIQSSSGTHSGANLVTSNSNLAEEGAMEPHQSEVEVDAVHFSTDGNKVKNSLVVPVVVQTDTVAKDLDSDEFSRAPVVEESSISKMTNGTRHDGSKSPIHETAAASLKCTQDTAPTSDLEPQSPTAPLYPLSEPPFSGCQQDRLWEEQAEAYSGQGTPSRNEDHATQTTPCASPAPGEKPTSCDDQIQPESVGAASNGHAAVGASNGGLGENGSCSSAQEPPKTNGKEKLHTPLRTLLLEDAGKNGFGDHATPNGVSSSPSFIRRLFRVMSTPSRTGDRDVSHTKLKKSSSMWVSCLGSPQVQQ